MQFQLFWGGPWPLLCKICRKTINVFPQKRKNAEEKSLHKVRKILLTVKRVSTGTKIERGRAGKNLKEMHLEKMRRFDRLLELYEKDISK